MSSPDTEVRCFKDAGQECGSVTAKSRGRNLHGETKEKRTGKLRAASRVQSLKLKVQVSLIQTIGPY